jgi:hypothetical protein
VQPSRIADRVTNGSDVRRGKCTIDAIRNIAAARLGLLYRCLDEFFRLFAKTKRPAFLPA